MIVLDANILLYAYDTDAPQQSAVAQWLSTLADGNEVIALPWVTIWAFLRISTSSRIYARPKTPEAAFSIVRTWLSQPGVVTVDPGPGHTKILEDLISTYGAAGSMVTDVVLAALAIENGAVLASTDQDFRRFPNLRWIDPLKSNKAK